MLSCIFSSNFSLLKCAISRGNVKRSSPIYISGVIDRTIEGKKFI